MHKNFRVNSYHKKFSIGNELQFHTHNQSSQSAEARCLDAVYFNINANADQTGGPNQCCHVCRKQNKIKLSEKNSVHSTQTLNAKRKQNKKYTVQNIRRDRSITKDYKRLPCN